MTGSHKATYRKRSVRKAVERAQRAKARAEQERIKAEVVNHPAIAQTTIKSSVQNAFVKATL